MDKIKQRYLEAKQEYEKLGVDVEKALEIAINTPVSIHCWQGDNVKGFISDHSLSGGIQVTGSYPYKANTVNQLQKDLKEVFKYVPGKKRVNLHAIYADTKSPIKLEDVEPKHFDSWIDFAKENNVGLDYNPTIFSHPLAESGFTLSSREKAIRDYWIQHCKKSRKIGDYLGKSLSQKTNVNIWIPDGYKDFPIDRINPRKRLLESLDEIYEDKYNNINDYVEAKLFGIGQEAYTTGSYDFYLGYAISRNKNVCIDTGHFHLSEEVYDKLPTALLYVDRVLLHLSRPMRWDSDHVVIFDDKLNRMMQTLVRNNLLEKVDIALDYFDGSISPLFAWVIGTRNVQRALLKALLEPVDYLKKLENEENYSDRMAYTEEINQFMFNDIFNYYCQKQNVPIGTEWITKVKKYEKNNKEDRH